MTQTGLDALATPDGTFAVLAMDQRGSLKKMVTDAGRPDPSDAELTALKSDMITVLAGVATAFLIDPTYGLPASRMAGTDAPFGVLLAAEPQHRLSLGTEPVVTLDPAQDAAWARSAGADCLKFFVQLRADRPTSADGRDTATEAIEATRSLIEDCREVGIPAVIENLIFPLEGQEPLSGSARADAIIEAAVRLDELGPDLLKLEYPGSPADCRRLAARIRSPWAVLSAGVDSDTFKDNLRISCDEGGASGFIAGRSVWRETVGMDHEERVTFLKDTGRRRLEEYVAIIDGRAVPHWQKTSRIQDGVSA